MYFYQINQITNIKFLHFVNVLRNNLLSEKCSSIYSKSKKNTDEINTLRIPKAQCHIYVIFSRNDSFQGIHAGDNATQKMTGNLRPYF